MSTISHAADVDFKFLSSQTCPRTSPANEGTATMIPHSSSECLLTKMEPTRCSWHRTTNIHVTQLKSVDLQGYKCHFLRHHVSFIAEAVC
jgi:hypothetical protein